MAKPQELPGPPERGRLALVDLAFANGAAYARITEPFIHALGPRLAIWVDHHDHDAWRDYEGDPRFVLVPKTKARACPELVTPEVVARAQPVEHLWAHADFDGLVAAATFLRGGHPPYPEAEEDARWADAPGHGFTVSPRGRRLALALDEASVTMKSAKAFDLLFQVVRALVEDTEPVHLSTQLDRLVDGLLLRQARLREQYLDHTVRPHPEVLLLELGKSMERADKKFLLREMEERADVAIVSERGHMTVATYHDEGELGFDLRRVPGLQGQRGFAWGRVPLEEILEALRPTLRRRSRGGPLAFTSPEPDR